MYLDAFVQPQRGGVYIYVCGKPQMEGLGELQWTANVGGLEKPPNSFARFNRVELNVLQSFSVGLF